MAHRIAEIQRLCPQASWHNIDGEINPADMGTRKKYGQTFINSSFLSSKSYNAYQHGLSLSSDCCLLILLKHQLLLNPIY